MSVDPSHTFMLHSKSDRSILRKVDDWVYAGDRIVTSVNSSDSGQTVSITDEEVMPRKGKLYLGSSAFSFHVCSYILN